LIYRNEAGAAPTIRGSLPRRRDRWRERRQDPERARRPLPIPAAA